MRICSKAGPTWSAKELNLSEVIRGAYINREDPQMQTAFFASLTGVTGCGLPSFDQLLRLQDFLSAETWGERELGILRLRNPVHLVIYDRSRFRPMLIVMPREILEEFLDNEVAKELRFCFQVTELIPL